MSVALDRPLEREIQKAVLDYMNSLYGFKVWRQNTGAFSGQHNGKKRFVRFGERGHSDLAGIGPAGVYVAIEIKRPGNKPTFDQAAFLNEIRALGGIAFWTDSVDACWKQLKHEYEQRRWAWNPNWEIQ